MGECGARCRCTTRPRFCTGDFAPIWEARWLPDSTQGTVRGLRRCKVRQMTDIQRAEIERLLKQQKAASLASREAARESLMRTGLYNPDGSLKAAHGGRKSKPAA